MTDALDDWEQAGEDDFQAPAVIIKPPKVPSAPTGGSKESGSTSLASVAERKGGQGLILFRKNHDQAMDRDKDVDFNAQVQQDSRSLHERNRDLWDKANSYEQPVISRSDTYSMRTEYVPEIKILRRPKSPVQAIKMQHTIAKPLAQREADYNAAREKIFGPSPSTAATATATAATNNPQSQSNIKNHKNNRPNNGPNSLLNSRSSYVSRSRSSSPSPSLCLPSPAQQTTSRSDITVRPIEFKSAPPSIRSAQRGSTSSSSSLQGIHESSAILRQPQGPGHMQYQSLQLSQQQQQQVSRSGGKMRPDRSESIGFRRHLQEAPPRPSQPRPQT